MPLYEGYYYAIAERDDLRAKFLLEPGEMLLWHNFQMLHARDAYQDSPEHTRHLPRLWLRIENDRPINPACNDTGTGRAHPRSQAQRSGPENGWA